MIKFDEATHTYTLNGKKLISVTQLMKKHGLAPNLDEVPTNLLNAKAERGSLIHKEIEGYIKNNEAGFTTELLNFVAYARANDIEVIESELMVYNDVVAGTCDLILNKRGGEFESDQPIIADIKTTYTLHRDAVSWQLSIYLWLYLYYDEIEPLASWEGFIGQAYHFDKDGNLNVIDIPLKPYQEVQKLLECERQGKIYNRDLQSTLGDLAELAKVEQLISSLEKQKKEAEEKAKKMRQALLDAMEANAVKTYETDKLKVTYVAPTTSTSIDTTKLKEEQPKIYEKYCTKVTNKKAYLTIKLKEEKEQK